MDNYNTKMYSDGWLQGKKANCNKTNTKNRVDTKYESCCVNPHDTIPLCQVKES
jgi:hypothetical protein